jgi:hypothetical protein
MLSGPHAGHWLGWNGLAVKTLKPFERRVLPVLFDAATFSFVSQCNHGIDTHGTAGGNVARCERHNC